MKGGFMKQKYNLYAAKSSLDTEPDDKTLWRACQLGYEKNRKNKMVDGLNYYYTYEDEMGLYVDVYFNNKSLVFVFNGTDIPMPNDIKADYVMGIKNKIPGQFDRAQRFFEKFQEISEFEGLNVIITGYSLGGSIAVYLGSKFGDRTVAFSPYGIGNLTKPRFVDNITNYGNPNDTIFMRNFEHQIGNIKYVFNSKNFESEHEYVKNDKLKEGQNIVDFHFPDKMGDIDFATDDITGQEFLNKVRRKYGGSIESAIEKYTHNSYKDIMQNSNNCPGYVDVKSYTRNGKDVSGYRRDCPYH